MGDELVHYGIKRRSGRYPYGSGENPYQHEPHLLHEYRRLKSEGLTDKEIATQLGMTIRELKARKSSALMLERDIFRAEATRLFNEGKSKREIARILGKPETTIRNYLANKETSKEAQLRSTVDILEKRVSESGYLDVGKGVATSMGITETRMEAALQALEDQGYTVETIYVEQYGNSRHYTAVKVLAKPGSTKRDIWQNRANIQLVNERFVEQNSTNVYGLKKPKSISSKRIEISYAEDGGSEKDGVIELRPGVEGLDLGEARYAQVRIAVDGKLYLKGMAVYSNDLPDGVDVRFNTNKKRGTPIEDTLKPLKSDQDNPFGAEIKPGGQKGYLNIVNEEGDWGKWSKHIASQVLSKQPIPLAKTQLEAAKAERVSELEEISALTNPTVRSYFLKQFADSCDTAAVELEAAARPRQATHVILPVNSLKENEIYAPKYNDGEMVVLIRYPHGGTFEMPELKVNNRNPEAKRIFENAKDAVGINSKVAATLSGADFDGDTVVVIPNNDRAFKNSPPIKDLQNFEPKLEYKATKDTIRIDDAGNTVLHNTAQKEMGVVTNLITDMTLRDAPRDHITRAVKYSMVIIDAEKHQLDWRKAKADNDIDGLQRIYQKKPNGRHGGASTLISRASAMKTVPEVRQRRIPDEEGRLGYYETNRTYTDKNGKEKKIQSKVPQMRLVDDARELSSGTVMEDVYADYANTMKALANRARKEAMAAKPIKRDSEAAKKYAVQVAKLNSAISAAEAYSPKERKAQLLANATLALKIKESDTELTSKQKSRILHQALTKARNDLGGPKPKVDISEKDWEAIQSGAISPSRLERALKYADQDKIRELAMPKDFPVLSSGKLALARARLNAGYTIKEVADLLGVSASTLSKAL